MKFIHIADLHIGKRLQSASFGGRIGAIKRQGIKENLSHVIDVCNAQGIGYLLMAGDCIEGESAQIGDWMDMCYLFQRLEKTQVIMIAGNHDALECIQSKVQTIQWPKHVTFVDSSFAYIEYPQDDVGFFCSSWKNKVGQSFDYEWLESHIAQTEMSRKIGVFHGDLYDEKGYMPLDCQRLCQSGLDYIGLGHIHKPEIIQEKIGYAGSLEPLDFSETGQHGYILGAFDRYGLHLKHVEHMVYPMKVCSVDVGNSSSNMEILDRIKKEIMQYESRDMVRLKLEGEMNVDFSQIEEAIGEDWCEFGRPYIHYLEVENHTRHALDMDAIYHEHQDDVIGYYIRSFQNKDKDNPVYKEALHLGVQLLLGEVE